MRTTPIYGWPYAEDTDPVKQFPTTVDGPRTLAIESEVINTRSGMQVYGTRSGTLPAAAWTLLNLTSPLISWGTPSSLMHLDAANNRVVIDRTGQYRTVSYATFNVSGDHLTVQCVNYLVCTAGKNLQLYGWRTSAGDRNMVAVQMDGVEQSPHGFEVGVSGVLAGTLLNTVAYLTVEYLGT